MDVLIQRSSTPGLAPSSLRGHVQVRAAASRACVSIHCKSAWRLPHPLSAGLRRKQRAPPARGRWQLAVVRATSSPPKGFGTPPKQQQKKAPKRAEDEFVLKRSKRKKGPGDNDEDEEEAAEEEEEEDDAIPEVVTDRMLKRMALTVGAPLAVGLVFWPLYYYLKQVQHVDIPTWIPLITSLFTYGAAFAGITYGVLSTSWDPNREGTLLGWTEAKANWPVLWQSFGKDKKKSRR